MSASAMQGGHKETGVIFRGWISGLAAKSTDTMAHVARCLMFSENDLHSSDDVLITG